MKNKILAANPFVQPINSFSKIKVTFCLYFSPHFRMTRKSIKFLDNFIAISTYIYMYRKDRQWCDFWGTCSRLVSPEFGIPRSIPTSLTVLTVPWLKSRSHTHTRVRSACERACDVHACEPKIFFYSLGRIWRLLAQTSWPLPNSWILIGEGVGWKISHHWHLLNRNSDRNVWNSSIGQGIKLWREVSWNLHIFWK